MSRYVQRPVYYWRWRELPWKLLWLLASLLEWAFVAAFLLAPFALLAIAWKLLS